MAYIEGIGDVPDEQIAPPAISNPETPKPTVAQAPAAKTPSFTDWLGSPEAMALASGFLKASGPSPVPISIGQAMGMGMEEMLKAKLQFGNQQLDKDKFGYQQKHDAQKLTLEGKHLDAQTRNWEDQRKLQERQIGIMERNHSADAFAKYGNAAKDIMALQQQRLQQEALFPGSTAVLPPIQTLPPLEAFQGNVENQTPQSGGLLSKPELTTATSNQPTGILNKPQQPITPPIGIQQNLPQITSPQPQAPTALPTQQIPPQQVAPLPPIQNVMRASLLSGKYSPYATMYNTQNQWETQKGFDESGKPIYTRLNKVTGEVQPIPGLTPEGMNLKFESQKQQITEENKLDQELRNKVFEQRFILDKFNNIRTLLDEGVKTGAGFDQITYLKNIANTMGLNVDEKNLNNAQFMKQQIAAAFSDYQRGTRIPGIGSQSDLEFDALKQQFLKPDLTPETLRNVMNGFQKVIDIKSDYLDQKQAWKSRFGHIAENNPSTGLSFDQTWRRYENQKYYGGKK